MSDIDYHSVYTQFITEKCNGSRINAIITKGYIGKISTPCNQVNIYQIVPSTVSENMLKSIEYNSKHPLVQKYYAISTSRDLPVETITIQKKTPTYSDIFEVMNPTSINIVLYDCVILDQVWTDYIRHIEPNTLGILSSKKFKGDIPLDVSVFNDNSEYKYDIDNFNGFVIYGKPSFDTPYYPNVFCSKHMLIRKFYSMKQNIVNLANTIPCYFLETNADYSTTDSYVPVPSFSIMIVQPQSESVNSELVIDEDDMFKDRDPTPLDVDISFDNMQVSIEDYVPFVKRVELSTIEHQLKRKFYQVYQDDCNQKLTFNTEKQLCLLRELDENIESVRKDKLLKLDDDYKIKTKELVTKYGHMQEQLQRELDTLRETKTKDIDDRVNAEMDVLRSKKSIELENETKNMYELLDAKYANAQKERQTALSVYEKNEHDRIDKEIRSAYDKKYDELNKHINERRVKLESDVNSLKSTMIAKIETDLRKEYVQKYNDEYIKSLAQIVSGVELKRNTMMVLLEKEINALKHHKVTEIDAWEQKQKAKAVENNSIFENEQRSHVNKLISDFYTTQMETIKKQIDIQYQQELEKVQQTVQKETDILRTQKLKSISSDIHEALTSKLKSLDAEIETLKHEKIAHIEIECEHEKQNLIRELQRYEEHEKSDIKSRLCELEDIERQELIKQREQEVEKQIKIMKELRECELSNQFNERMATLEHEFARKESDYQKVLHEKKMKAISGLEAYLKEEDSKLEQHKKLFSQKLKAEESRLREEAISARQVYVDSEIADLREKYSKQVQKEYDSEIEKMKVKLEKDKKEYAETLASVKELLQDKQTVELNTWTEHEKSKRMLQLESDYEKLETHLKELYEIKKFEYADAFTKEMKELEKSRIGFHAREQSRLAQELVHIKEKALESIDSDILTVKKERINEIESELKDVYANRVKEIEDRVVAETDTIFHSKIREIEERLEMIATGRVNERIEKRRIEIESEFEQEKLEKLKQADEQIAIIRQAALQEVEVEFEKLKESKNAQIRQLDNEYERQKVCKLEDLEKEIQTIREQKLQDLQKKLEEEHSENERRRKAKIREMEELVSRLHA
jgi:hypothetical protein